MFPESSRTGFLDAETYLHKVSDLEENFPTIWPCILEKLKDLPMGIQQSTVVAELGLCMAQGFPPPSQEHVRFFMLSPFPIPAVIL